MSEAMEISIEQAMQNHHRGVRERLGMAFNAKPVVVPRKFIPAAVEPLWPENKPEPEPFRQSRKIPTEQMKSVTANMIWNTQMVPVTVAAYGEWDRDNSQEKITIINSRWRMIMKEVCAKHGVSILDIRSHRRAYPVARARHELFYRLRMETALSLPQTGQRIGDFDHSTILSGIKRHLERIKDGSAL